jgi:hypothetical protein
LGRAGRAGCWRGLGVGARRGGLGAAGRVVPWVGCLGERRGGLARLNWENERWLRVRGCRARGRGPSHTRRRPGRRRRSSPVKRGQTRPPPPPPHLVVVRVRREQPTVHHRLHVLVAGQRRGRGHLFERDGVADARVLREGKGGEEGGALGPAPGRAQCGARARRPRAEYGARRVIVATSGCAARAPRSARGPLPRGGGGSWAKAAGAAAGAAAAAAHLHRLDLGG